MQDRFETDQQADKKERDRAEAGVSAYFEYEQYIDSDSTRSAVMLNNAKKVMEYDTTGRISKRSAFGEYK